jgi:hypothetical protein
MPVFSLYVNNRGHVYEKHDARHRNKRKKAQVRFEVDTGSIHDTYKLVDRHISSEIFKILLHGDEHTKMDVPIIAVGNKLIVYPFPETKFKLKRHFFIRSSLSVGSMLTLCVVCFVLLFVYVGSLIAVIQHYHNRTYISSNNCRSLSLESTD